ncbi:hypothetical protein ADK53_28675 [Streptomyces sp. WM6373]|uniref:hypothetical protein n=1 Tax=Streptomyces sp. WM6373 TaxID=1415556 RepID=UPI0006AE99A4|nr:hypothetical protein [Streptomyces sp. WM6373]KOU30195.1 hypothetical protein ADK53_28675 [Streptomyces sp. WM6373]
MATQNSTQATPGTSTPVRRLVAAGIKRGPAAWLVEQPHMSAADKATHDEATYIRRPQSSAA